MAQPNEGILYWSTFKNDSLQFYIAATKNGLCYVGSPGKPFDELAEWAGVRLPNFSLERNDEELRLYAKQLKEYFEGKRSSFTLPLDLHGTPFQLSVWNALHEISHGATCSYSDLAERMSSPKAVRAIAAAIGANPVLIAVPCHRVIGKNGSLTGYRGGLAMKEALLRLERKYRYNLV